MLAATLLALTLVACANPKMPPPPKYDLGFVFYDSSNPHGFKIRYYPKHQPGKFDYDESTLVPGSVVFKPDSWGVVLGYINALEEAIKGDSSLKPTIIFLDEDEPAFSREFHP